jgi:hypothetical protein
MFKDVDWIRLDYDGVQWRHLVNRWLVFVFHKMHEISGLADWTVNFISLLMEDDVYSCHVCRRSRDSSVGIANGYGLDDGGVGVLVPVGSRIFSSLRRPGRLWVNPTSYPVGAGVKRPGREADHSPLTSEGKETWISTSTLRHAFMSCLLVKYSDIISLPCM